MEKDLISVILPVYNVEKYLKQCVESIQAQTYSNLEIILVDDGSTDNSGKICDELANKDARIRVIHKVNGGTAVARNAGVDAANGEYVGFVDSDDYIYPDMYRRLYESIKKYDTRLAICNGVNFYEEDHLTEKIIVSNRELCTDGLRGMSISIAAWNACYNKLYHRELFATLRFRNKASEDGFLMADLTGIVEKVSFTPYIGYCYRKMRQGSNMNKPFSERQMDRFEVGELVYDKFIRTKYKTTAVVRLYKQYCYVVYKLSRVPVYNLYKCYPYMKKMQVSLAEKKEQIAKANIGKKRKSFLLLGARSTLLAVLSYKLQLLLGIRKPFI